MSIKDFQILTKLGEGAYSSVFKVKRLIDEQMYALKKVKLINLSEKQKANALNQVRILASFRHPNIVGYKQAFFQQNSNSLCIVMQYLDGGDLYKKILQQQNKGENFEESYIWNIFIQIVRGLKALHQSNILHRDLKSANVFLTKTGIAKIGDMNVSKVTRKGFGQTQTGTPYYASPQVWKDQVYNSKSDLWSLGCVLYETITLKPPFRAADMQGLFKKVTRGSYHHIPSTYSLQLSQIIRMLLKQKPQQRPSCQQILNFEFIKKKLQENVFLQPQSSETRLLKTIKITKNMLYLTDKMPKPNYSPLKYKLPSSRNKSVGVIFEQQNHVNSMPFLQKVPRRKLDNSEVLRKKILEIISKKDKDRFSLPPIHRSPKYERKDQNSYQLKGIQLPQLKKQKDIPRKIIYL